MSRIRGPWDLFEEIEQPPSDPARPEIVILAGFLGLHLARAGGFRIWLTPPSFALCDVATELSVDPSQPELSPDGLNEIVYTDLIYDLRHAGFVVHAFAFDFRRRVLDIAADLAKALIALGDDKRFVFVAHSMGALVATVYPEVDPEWKSRVERAIFLGGTLSGTFEVVDAALGVHPIIGRLSRLSLRNDAREYAACMRTWPGLYDLLPDPAMFDDAMKAFEASAWPEGQRPDPGLLRDAWITRQSVTKSALFSIPCAQILSVRFSTADAYAADRVAAGAHAAAGDGTVPARTAMVAGVPAYRVDLPHTLIPLDPSAIRGVLELIMTGECTLPRVTEEEASARIEGNEPTLDEIVAEYVMTTLAHPERIGRLIWLGLLLGPPAW